MRPLRITAICAVTAVAVLETPLRAGAESYPFAITVEASRDKVAVICSGPYFRSSDCQEVPGRGKRTVFYTAESNIFPVQGDWGCVVSSSCFVGRDIDGLSFCGPGAGNAPKEVELTLRSDGGLKLSSNQASSCTGTPIVARSVLG
jgi:hypothetical protein